MHKPLQGIRVVELSTFVAAPVSARLLADLGAEVIKVEQLRGDDWRQTGIGYLPLRYSNDENPVFDIYNAGKKHIALNLKTPEGMEAFHKLLATADVMITNTRPKSLEKLGLNYEALKERYPRLVYGIVLGYGEKGPDKDMRAFDTSAFWARGGFLLDQSPRGEHYRPVQPPYSMGDTVTGYLLMAEVCAALYRREQTGTGDYVRSSLFHNGIFAMGTMNIITQKPYGRVFPDDRAGYGATCGDFACSDGEWVFISGYNAAMNRLVYKMIGKEDIEEDPRFADTMSRYKNRAAFHQILQDAFLKKPSTYWLEQAKLLDIPMTRMGHYSDIANDPQAWANDYLENVEFRNGHVDVMPRSPIEMDSVGTLTTRIAPGIGADTHEVLEQLGYTPQQLDEMIASGAIK